MLDDRAKVDATNILDSVVSFGNKPTGYEYDQHSNISFKGLPLPERDMKVSVEYELPKDPVAPFREELKRITSLTQEPASPNTPIFSSQQEQDSRVRFLRQTIKLAVDEHVPNIGSALRDITDYTNFNTMERIGQRLKAEGYCLEINGAPVMLISNNRNSVIAAGAKKEFFRELSFDNKHAIEITQDLSYGDYAANGALLTGKARAIAAAFFHKVKNGQNITPLTGNRMIQEMQSGDYRENLTAVPQHWGQEFLAHQKPTKIVPGVLFGSGETCNAYHFGTGENDIIVVEGNRLGVATLVVTPQGFDNIQSMGREQIMIDSDSINGLIARTVHPRESVTSVAKRKSWYQILGNIISEANRPQDKI